MKKVLFPFVITMAFFCLLFKFIHGHSRSLESIGALTKEFLKSHKNLSSLTPEEVSILAYAWQKKLADEWELEMPIQIIDPEKVQATLDFLQEKGGKIIMRHGEQKKTRRVQNLEDKALQKIEMMRKPENINNPITENSLVDFLGTAIVFRYLEAKLKGSVQIETAKNRRSSMVADVLGKFLEKKPMTKPILRCIDYPPEETFSSYCLLRELSRGMLPWEKESIDFIVGKGTYWAIMENMRETLQRPLIEKEIQIQITHTQQINAVQSILQLPVERLSYFGFVVVSGGKGQTFPKGFYQ